MPSSSKNTRVHTRRALLLICPPHPQSGGNRWTERQKTWVTVRSARKATADLMGENRIFLFFLSSFITPSPIHRHVIRAGADHRACEGRCKRWCQHQALHVQRCVCAAHAVQKRVRPDTLQPLRETPAHLLWKFSSPLYSEIVFSWFLQLNQ